MNLYPWTIDPFKLQWSDPKLILLKAIEVPDEVLKFETYLHFVTQDIREPEAVALLLRQDRVEDEVAYFEQKSIVGIVSVNLELAKQGLVQPDSGDL